MTESAQPPLKSCGFLLYRVSPRRCFLLMKHADRWDLPKGHVDPGESDMDAALRELKEETGIAQDDISIDDQFRFELRYPVYSQDPNKPPRDKTLVVFLAEVLRDVAIELTEHIGFQWFDWDPPHQIQGQTLDPLLSAVQAHWNKNLEGRS